MTLDDIFHFIAFMIKPCVFKKPHHTRVRPLMHHFNEVLYSYSYKRMVRLWSNPVMQFLTRKTYEEQEF